MPPLPPLSSPSLSRPVVVFGAAGFIGRFVVAELRRQQWPVRAFIRPVETNPFFNDAGVDVVTGDIRDAAAVDRALAGVAAAINLSGAKSDEPDSEAVNVGGAENLVAAARVHGDVRLVHFSTQAVKIARPGVYARTKLAADRVFESSGLPVTILRPSIVYGPGPSGVFATMHRAIYRLPVVPVLGDGRWVSAPVHVNDVAFAAVACLATPVTIGRCYDLAGPDALRFDDLLDRIAAHSGRRCRKLHLPFPLALMMARIAARVFSRPPLSVSNVLGSNQPIPIDPEPARRDFGFNPITLEAGLRRMAASWEDAAQAEEARHFARYLIDEDIDDEILQRYLLAVRELFTEPVDGDLAFVRRHRWSLPLLDAATAVVRPRSQVRRRVFLMAALLEASPRHADFFLAPPPRRWSLVLGLMGRGLSSATKLFAGVLLLPFVRSSCRRTLTSS